MEHPQTQLGQKAGTSAWHPSISPEVRLGDVPVFGPALWQVSRHGVGTQQLHLKQEYFWLLVFHFRMRFEKWKGCTMGKLGFDHSNLFSSREIWVNIPRIPFVGLRASKTANYIGSFGQM